MHEIPKSTVIIYSHYQQSLSTDHTQYWVRSVLRLFPRDIDMNFFPVRFRKLNFFPVRSICRIWISMGMHSLRYVATWHIVL